MFSILLWQIILSVIMTGSISFQHVYKEYILFYTGYFQRLIMPKLAKCSFLRVSDAKHCFLFWQNTWCCAVCSMSVVFLYCGSAMKMESAWFEDYLSENFLACLVQICCFRRQSLSEEVMTLYKTVVSAQSWSERLKQCGTFLFML